MLKRLKAFLQGDGAGAGRDDGVSDVDAEARAAAAALLVEAAVLDGSFDDDERRVITATLADHFGLAADAAAELVAEAEAAVADAVELHGFARAVRDRFDADGRVRVIEMLWEVAYADGVLHDYEANLVRRVAGLLYVSDRESGEARKRVLARSGPADGGRNGAKP